MSPISLAPPAVAEAHVRRLPGAAETGPQVHRMRVPGVPAPRVALERTDPSRLRLRALELENAELRAELARLRTS